MSAMCCPLSECDEQATVWNAEIRTARKEHRCCECEEAIPIGVRYEYISMLFDGSWDTFRLCLSCQEIGKHFACGNGRVICTLWNDLEENFYPDMKAGGPCMHGLSPEAKARLISRRMDWYFSQGEIEDSQWDGWTPDKPPSPLRSEPPDARTVLFDDGDQS